VAGTQQADSAVSEVSGVKTSGADGEWQTAEVSSEDLAAMVPPGFFHTPAPAADAPAHHRHTELFPSATPSAAAIAVTGTCVNVIDKNVSLQRK
jgi:hypothetical protein